MTWPLLALALLVASAACLIALIDHASCAFDAALQAAFNP